MASFNAICPHLGSAPFGHPDGLGEWGGAGQWVPHIEYAGTRGGYIPTTATSHVLENPR